MRRLDDTQRRFDEQKKVASSLSKDWAQEKHALQADLQTARAQLLSATEAMEKAAEGEKAAREELEKKGVEFAQALSVQDATIAQLKADHEALLSAKRKMIAQVYDALRTELNEAVRLDRVETERIVMDRVKAQYRLVPLSPETSMDDSNPTGFSPGDEDVDGQPLDEAVTQERPDLPRHDPDKTKGQPNVVVDLEGEEAESSPPRAPGANQVEATVTEAPPADVAVDESPAPLPPVTPAPVLIDAAEANPPPAC